MAPAASEAAAFAAQVVRGRWFMAYGSFLIMSAAGATYIFAIYSKDIKSALGYTQEQLNTVGFFKDVGANVGIHAGLVAELAPPWLVLAIGAAMNLAGYLMLYLSVTRRGGGGTRTPLWLVCLYIAVGANSQAFANTGALVTCVRNFPGSRGVMLGLLKGFVGLSGAISTQLYLAFYYGGDTRPLILLVACLPAAVSVAFLATIRIIPARPRRPRDDYRALCAFLYASLALAAFLLVAIVLQKRFRFTRAEYAASAAAVVFLLLLLPLAIVLREEAAARRSNTTNPTPAAATPPQNVLPAATKQPPPPPAATETTTGCQRLLLSLRPPARGEDYTILQAVASVDMLLLFTATVFGVGGTLAAIDNMGQIGESLGYPQRSVATFVSLISIWNYLGRVAAGFASEALLSSRHRVPRPLLVAAVLLLAVPGHLLIALGVPGSLYAASVLVGFCFGAAYPMILAVISELFGLRHYSTLYNVGNVASPVGSYILNVRVAGRMYDREAARQEGGVTCVGRRCYRESFVIIAAVTVGAAAAALVLAWRTRAFYAGDIYARFKEGDTATGASVGEDEGASAAAAAAAESVTKEHAKVVVVDARDARDTSS